MVRASTEITDDQAVSHGRGGTGNISKDDTPYGDGEIVRQGIEGEGGAAFSTGRGGAANIGSPGLKAVQRTDDEIIPDSAIRQSLEGQNVHVGRGGAGNVLPTDDKVQMHRGLADKLKDKLFRRKPKTADETDAPIDVDEPTATEEATETK